MTKLSHVSVSEFLSAFYPDKKERICLRTYKPKAAPKDFIYPKKRETSREELTTNTDVQKRLTKSNERNGV